MRIEGLIFSLLSVFLLVMAGIYWLVSRDPTGFTCILLSGGLLLIIGYYLLFTARRIDLRPEDREDGEIAEGAGEIGFFSPGSYWPFGIALAASVAGMGLVFWMWWLIALGLIMVIFGACGMLFEYYSGTRHTAEH